LHTTHHASPASRARQAPAPAGAVRTSLASLPTSQRTDISLCTSQAGLLAQRRLSRGCRLNHAEATALIATVLQEKIRDGDNSVADLMSWGKKILGYVHVRGEVPALLRASFAHAFAGNKESELIDDRLDHTDEVMVEGTFVDGTFLVTVHDPICSPEGNLQAALYGSGLQMPDPAIFLRSPPKVLHGADLPGAIVVAKTAGPIVLCKDRKRFRIRVTNTGDRPIQVGSREWCTLSLTASHPSSLTYHPQTTHSSRQTRHSPFHAYKRSASAST